MGAYLQAALGLLVLIGLGWGVFALIRLLEPAQHPDSASRAASPRGARTRPGASDPAAGPRPPAAGLGGMGVAGPPRAPVARCCPDCTGACQVTGLAMGQAWGRGDDWWGQPFGGDGPNSEAMVFWGDECCPQCASCPICQNC
jgi:hypothetical protein